jgi:hypothetical protein
MPRGDKSSYGRGVPDTDVPPNAAAESGAWKTARKKSLF